MKCGVREDKEGKEDEELKENLKKMFGYYKPYMGIFWADMFFAMLSAGVALTIPLVVRYVTTTLIYMERSDRAKDDLYRNFPVRASGGRLL